MTGRFIRLLLPMLLASAGSAGAQAQVPGPVVVAVPPLTTPDQGTKGNQALAVAWQASQLIASDLGSTADLVALPQSQKDYYSYPEVTAPQLGKWRSAGAKVLLMGFVQQRSDGRLTFGCYAYDVASGRELGRKGFVVAQSDWRRAAHKCSGLAYQAATGAPGIFDTRIAYVAESGFGDARIKRVAVMDSDGSDHRFVTLGDTMALTPRLWPRGNRVAFVSFTTGVPQIRVADLSSGEQHPLVVNDAISFAPRYSPDGNRIAFSMMLGPNSDIYLVGANGGPAQRLTTSPAIDTDPSFSPDGSKIVFESDRGGSQQLYVMNADGSNQRRLTFSPGWYAAPVWSPDGQWIAFTRRGAEGRRIGIIKPDGTGEKLLTTGPTDEGASWATSSREILFQRTDATSRAGLYRIGLGGGQPRKVTIPQEGSDPDWSGPMD